MVSEPRFFKEIGININTVPVLDVRRSFTHNIIADRSYSENINTVSKIGDICINKFHKNKIATVVKHIPGHGLAKVDSHKKMPVIDLNFQYLLKHDFKTFKFKSAFSTWFYKVCRNCFFDFLRAK